MPPSSSNNYPESLNKIQNFFLTQIYLTVLLPYQTGQSVTHDWHKLMKHENLIFDLIWLTRIYYRVCLDIHMIGITNSFYNPLVFIGEKSLSTLLVKKVYFLNQDLPPKTPTHSYISSSFSCIKNGFYFQKVISQYSCN